MANQFERFESELEKLSSASRKRSLSPIVGFDFTSNDFLGLSGSVEIRKAIIAALRSGIPLGSGGSRLLRGNHPAHLKLEKQAARLFRSERALFFANGYLANFAVLTTLPKRHDLIIFDALSHASIRQGVSASFAKSVKTPHNDADAIERALSKWHRSRSKDAMAWIAVESLYSMDGDFAPLEELLDIAVRYDAMLVIDEAHATGVWGKRGHGLTEQFEGHQNIIAIHTCGKALAASGGLVCGPRVLVDFMINKSPSFIFSTAPPPINAVAVSTALRRLGNRTRQRKKLHKLIEFANQKFEETFEMPGSGSQIIPFIVGDDALALKVAKKMQRAGFDIRAIRPPTVPDGTARLRISITLNVLELHITNFMGTLYDVMQSLAPKRS